MRPRARIVSGSLAAVVLATTLFLAPGVTAHESHLQQAPSSYQQMTNPYRGKPQAAAEGKKLYGSNCAQCHGMNRQGGAAPALDNQSIRNAKPGALFWFISTGNVAAGMPSWSALPKNQLWQIVTFLQSSVTTK